MGHGEGFLVLSCDLFDHMYSMLLDPLTLGKGSADPRVGFRSGSGFGVC